MLAYLVKFQARNLLSNCIALAAAGLLAACGGGGSGRHHPVPPPAPPPPPQPGVMYDVIQLIEDPTAIIRVTPTGINESDMVTGTIFLLEGRSRAFLYNGAQTIDLGDLGGGNSQAFGINRCAHVAGWSSGPGEADASLAFLYDGTLRNLGTPGLFSQANAVNNCVQVVGAAQFGGQVHAFLYDGVMRDLGTLPGGTGSSGVDINAAGVVTGNSTTADSPSHAFIYDSRTSAGLQDLGTAGGTASRARAINDAGQVAGSLDINEEGVPRAFRYSGGIMQNLGTLEGDNVSEGLEINASGFVVGGSASSVSGRQRGFMYDGVQMHDVGTLGFPFTEALAINASGVVVGQGALPDAPTSRAISWTLAEGIVDLNTRLHAPPPGLVVTRAMAINDRGSIVATSTNGLVLLRLRR